MKKIIAFLIMLAVFLYFNNSKKIKKEGFYSVSFFYSDNKEKIFEVEDIEIDYFKNIIIKLKKIYNKMELKKIIVYNKDKKIGEIIVNERLGIDSLKDAKYIVGNITFDETSKFGCNEKLKNKYNGYFYINYFDDNDARFNLTRDEVKSKFNKKWKYKKAKKFLNEYGKGVIDLTKEIIFFNFFFSSFLTFCVWIIILILKKLYSISKTWLYQ